LVDEIKDTGTEPKVIRYEATPEEMVEIFLFDADQCFVGSEWRLKEEVTA